MGEDMRIRYVREYRDGRCYFQRHRRGRKVRIKAERDTPEFHAEYARLLGQHKSAAFKGFGRRQQSMRRGVLESTWEEPVKPGSATTFGTVRLEDLTTNALRVLRDRKA